MVLQKTIHEYYIEQNSQLEKSSEETQTINEKAAESKGYVPSPIDLSRYQTSRNLESRF